MSQDEQTRKNGVGMSTLMTEQEAGAILRVTVKTLQGWRYRGGGPPFVKVGRCVRYRLEDLQAFVTAAIRTSTSDPGSKPRGSLQIRTETLMEKTGRALGPGEPTDPPVSNKPR